MWEKIKNNQWILLLLLTGAVYFFLRYISPLVGPILVAMLFVMIFGPLLKKMQAKFHIHRQVGAILLLSILVLFLTILIWILYSWIFGSIPVWMKQFGDMKEEVFQTIRQTCRFIGNLVGVDGAYLEQTFLGKISEGFGKFGQWNVSGVLSQSLSYVKVLGEIGGFFLTFLIATVLLAKDYDDIMNRLLESESCHVLLEVICGVVRYFATYVKAQFTIMLTNSTISAVALGMFGIYHGVLWGILAGILDALPFVGTGIVLVPLAISQIFAEDYVKAAVCLILYGICILLRQILEPKLIGRRMGVPPVAILLSLYTGIKLFGLIGILKGPIGFVLVWYAYLSLRRSD